MFKRYIFSILLSASLLLSVPVSATEVTTSQEASSETIELVNASSEAAVEHSSSLSQKERQAQKKKNAEENDEHGITITIIAMSIVLGALIVLSILFLVFGKISESLLTKKKMAAHGVSQDADSLEVEPDSGEVIAAISAALSEHFAQKHDIEDTILTIVRMKKSYSPWNSKIYNLRQMPEVAANPRRQLK